MNKRDEILPLIMEGLTIHEIMDRLGYKSDSSIYAVAKENGIKLASTSGKRAEQVKLLREQGKSAKEIAECIGISEGHVREIAEKLSIGFKRGKTKKHSNFKQEIRKCGVCGAEFLAKQPNHKYCCIECQRKANRTPKGELDESVAIDALAKHSDWEYVGGYTGSDGSMVIRHKACGFTTRKSSVSIRHIDTKPNGLKCFLCEQRERAQREEQRRVSAEAKQYKRIHFKPIKYKTYSLKECCVCGALFFPEKRESICSDECRKARMNHQWSMKKEKRRKQAWTSESNQINVRSVFERDNGICWLCGEPCDIDADPNDNRYPSVDHVTPIARGGLDEWSNVRLAHRLCNSLKCTTIIEDPDAFLTSLRSGQ